MSRARVTLWIATLVVVLFLGLLYIGITHRDRCNAAGFVGCSLVPWSGHAYVSPASRIPFAQ